MKTISNWYAIYVGDQKKIGHLQKFIKGVYRRAHFWLPVEPNAQCYNKRYPEMKALFPGYLFVCLPESRALTLIEALQESTLGQFLREDGKHPKIFTKLEMRKLRATEKRQQHPAKGRQVSEEESTNALKVNDIVEICNGPYIRASGTVVALKKRKTLATIRITLWGRSVEGVISTEVLQKDKHV